MAYSDARRSRVMSQKATAEDDFEPWPETKVEMVKHWEQPRIILLTPESDNFKMYATTKERMWDALEEVYQANPCIKTENIWPVNVVNMALFQGDERFSLPRPVWSEDYIARMPGEKQPEKKQTEDKNALDTR